MNEYQTTRIILQQSQPTSYYSEQEVAEYSALGIRTIRRLRVLGLIEGIEVTAGELGYSEETLAQLRRIRRLQRDLGVNLAGVEVILRLLKRIEALQDELEHK